MLLRGVFFLYLFAFSQMAFGDDTINDVSESRKFILDSVVLEGNKVTRPKVFHNEFTFQVGDTLTQQQISEHIESTKNNLLNTSLFNFVWITPLYIDEHLYFIIKVQERWYWWVLPILEHANRNFSAFLDDGDWSRIRYGAYVQNVNFLGRKKTLRFLFKLGYQNVFNFSYVSPQYKYKFGWGAGADYFFQDQIIVKTVDNKPVNSPYYTSPAIKKKSVKGSINYRHNLYFRHEVILTAIQFAVNDSILIENPNYLPNNKSSISYIELTYKYNHDTRDSKIYPLKGRYYGFDITNLGVGSNDLNYIYGGLHYKFFAPLPARFNIGTEWDAMLSNSSYLPYFVNFGLGYKDFIRGFEYNVIDAKSYYISQNRLMFNLLPTKTFNLNFLSLSQFSKVHYAFYLKTYFDMGYVVGNKTNKYINSNNMSDKFLCAGGLGLDFVTYYDKVFGVSYSINNFGVSGVYFHVNLKM